MAYPDPTNNSAPQRKRLHPLVATAAAAIIVASLAAVAAVTGLIPGASSNSAPTGQAQVATTAPPAIDPAPPSAIAAPPQVAMQAPPPVAPPAPQVARNTPPPAPGLIAPTYNQAPVRQAAPCQSCGIVQAVVAVRRQGHGTGLGAVGGAVVGGVVGNQFGGGAGRTGMTLLGALGGGVAGNAVEGRLRSETDYQVRVRMENGRNRYFTYRNPPQLREGQRVRIERGTLVAAG